MKLSKRGFDWLIVGVACLIFWAGVMLIIRDIISHAM